MCEDYGGIAPIQWANDGTTPRGRGLLHGPLDCGSTYGANPARAGTVLINHAV